MTAWGLLRGLGGAPAQLEAVPNLWFSYLFSLCVKFLSWVLSAFSFYPLPFIWPLAARLVRGTIDC